MALPPKKEFVVYCEYIVEKYKDDNFDQVVESEYRRRDKKSRSRSVDIVHSVWNVNKFRGELTRRLFDCAMYKGANVVELLRHCQRTEWMDCEGVMGGGGQCDVTNDEVAHRTALILDGHKYVMRTDIAKIVKFYHVLCWYPSYLSSLFAAYAQIDVNREYNTLHFMNQAIIDTIVANH